MLATAIVSIELMKLNHLIITLLNSVIIYSSGNSETVHQLSEVMQAHSEIWEKCENVVNISELHWMSISLIDDWQSKYICKSKIYSLDKTDWEFIDAEFNKLHTQNKIKWFNKFISFSYSCFVV